MEKLMEVLEAFKIDKHGVILLGQNVDLDILSEDNLKQYIGDSITLCNPCFCIIDFEKRKVCFHDFADDRISNEPEEYEF